MTFRTQPALKESFERAFALQGEFSNYTVYLEDCLRALIQHTRLRKRIAMPLALLTPEEEDRLRNEANK